MAINLNHFKTRVVRYTALVVALMSALFTTGATSDFDNSDWSSWVQAVGSIAALGIAIFVMSRQNSHAIRIVVNTDRRALMRRGNAVLAMMSNAHHTVDFYCSDLLGLRVSPAPPDIKSSFMAMIKSLEESRSPLATVPLHELGSEKMVNGVLRVLENMTYLRSAVEGWAKRPHQALDGAIVADAATRYMQNVKDAVELYKEGLRALEAAEF